MRIIFYTAIIALFSFNAWGQKLTASVIMENADFLKEADKGHYQWVLPSSLLKSEIEKSASYYVSSFKYTLNEKNNAIDIYALNNSEEDRRIILRFLGANHIQTIIYNNVNYELYSFYDSFMKINEK